MLCICIDILLRMDRQGIKTLDRKILVMVSGRCYIRSPDQWNVDDDDWGLSPYHVHYC